MKHKYYVMRREGDDYRLVYSCDRADEANAKVNAYGKDRCERWNKTIYADWLTQKEKAASD